MYTIVSVQAKVTHVATRIPFRYGIAEMTQAPHVVVEVSLKTPTSTSAGWASEHLPPKWFTKDPDSPFSDDIADMVTVITHAVACAEGMSGDTPFDIWRQLNAEQQAWGDARGLPGLLTGLGTSLVERALIDAACRAADQPFSKALLAGSLGFDAGAVHPELAGVPIAELFPAHTPTTIAVRHTVGLADALTDAELTEPAPDDLPVSLEATLRRYGASHLKIKTVGNLEADAERLSAIISLAKKYGEIPHFTIDGNESMTEATHFVTWMRGLLSHSEIGTTLQTRLIAIEQPFHRSMAHSHEAQLALAELSERVAVIVDESDDSIHAVRAALDLGYAGGTYKGCKGVFRGLANSALITVRGRTRHTLFTAEDLSTLPPLTVAQDLVVAATMGLGHIERNGHHYFAQLAPLSSTIEDDAVASHPDIYERGRDGRVRLRIQEGALTLSSVLAAPFGFAPSLDISALSPLTVESAVSGLTRE